MTKAKERKRLLQIFGHLYERHYTEEGYRCFYCNEAADGLDHVPPISWVETYSKEFWKENQYPFATIPCCRDCNSALGNRRLFSVEDRLKFLESFYDAKFTKEYIPWSEAEIREMGPFFQKSIRARQEKARIFLDKVQAVQKRLIKPDTFPDVYRPDFDRS